MKISVVIPTMGRAEQVKECALRLFETTEKYDVELVAVVDADFETVRALLIPNRDITVVHRPEVRGAPTAWNDGLKLTTGDILVFGSDDVWWGKGWLEAALGGLKHLPDSHGLVGFNSVLGEEKDRVGNRLHAHHYLFTRKFCVEYLGGVMGYPCYKFAYNDSEATERARRAGRYIWIEEARVEHRHCAYGYPDDATYRRNRPLHGRDSTVYFQRAKRGFPDDFPAAISQW